MQNIKSSVKGSILTLEIDLTQELGPSASGKTMLVASTQGNASIGGVKVGVNVFKPRS